MNRKFTILSLGIVLGLFTFSQGAHALPKWVKWCCAKNLDVCCKRAQFKEVLDSDPFPNDPSLAKEKAMWDAVQKANTDAMKSFAVAEAKMKAAEGAVRSANQNLENSKRAVEAARLKVEATKLPE